ncbi:MAG TPA: hypothetical protein VGO11_25720, partial [Chthoniobacteraceae bacterium]|nr:hypothetical protein [Chthoniobacteraceae bacterium]
MKFANRALLVALLTGLVLSLPSVAQVNSGSNGHDGALNPTSNMLIDMADHPDGIYQYTSINIPGGVSVTFKPNARNTPVVWLSQGNCTIYGEVLVQGETTHGNTAGKG